MSDRHRAWQARAPIRHAGKATSLGESKAERRKAGKASAQARDRSGIDFFGRLEGTSRDRRRHARRCGQIKAGAKSPRCGLSSLFVVAL